VTQNRSLVLRLLLFFAGAGVIILAFFLLTSGRELTGIDAFVWISIGSMYLVFFLPFFFSVLNVGNFSIKAPSLPPVWLSIFLYIGISIANIILLVFVPFISLNISIIVQSILLFSLGVIFYFAYFASLHAGNVAAEEASKKQYLKQIKPRAQSLLLAVNGLPSEHEKTQKTLRQALEDIRFISPVNDGMGNELEMQIIRSLNVISELCGGISTGAYPVSLETEAEKLRAMVKERKLLRN